MSHDEQDATQEENAKMQLILHQLFGSKDLNLLQSLSREHLIASIDGTQPYLASRNDSITTTAGYEDLATSPQDGHAWNESPQSTTYENVTDDVNGLSLSVTGATSYVGISSISTGLKVISAIDPAFQSKIAGVHPEPTGMTTTSYTESVDWSDLGDEQAYIDAYFTCIHGLVPMIDESAFRKKFIESSDTSTSWRLLLSMVLIMGSICTPAPSHTHSALHAQVRPLLTFECFQYGTIEMVQALSLYGGFYCHFLVVRVCAVNRQDFSADILLRVSLLLRNCSPKR